MHRHNAFPLSTVLLVAANLLIPVAIVLFAIGFFPYKPFLPGLAEYKPFENGPPPEAPFDRIIFMVIDAFRLRNVIQLIGILRAWDKPSAAELDSRCTDCTP